jgi:hypothetical protein
MQLLERRFEVARPADEVWRVLTRVEDWPSWARHIRSIRLEPPGPLGSESVGVIRLKNGVRSSFRTIRFEPGASWAWAGKFLWLFVHYDHVLTPRGPERTEVYFRVESEGFLEGSLGRVFAAIYAKSLDRAIPNLIAELESTDART